MSRDIPIIDMAEAKDQAEEMGREIGEEHPDMDVDDVAHFKESHRWNNYVGKRLRILAGKEDMVNAGTYHGDRTVAVIPEGNTDDVPAMGVLMNASGIYDELEIAWRKGLFSEVSDDARY